MKWCLTDFIQLGPDVVFPGAGFIAMAMEAIFQKTEALATLEGTAKFETPQYRLRNVEFNKALVLSDSGSPSKIQLSLSRHSVGDWHQFRISSLADDIWTEHVRGLVRTEENEQPCEKSPPSIAGVSTDHDVQRLVPRTFGH